MITGDIKNKIDALWESFWTAGITNSLTVVEQMTYLLFMKLLDDKLPYGWSAVHLQTLPQGTATS